MDASRFQHDHAAVVPNKAFGYEKRDGEWRTANSMLDVVGDGGMYASLDDMLAWTKNLLSPRIGARAIELMRSPAVLTSGASTGYGMGLQIGAHRGLGTLEHGGGLAGYRTEVLAYPAEGFGVVVLCDDAAA
jgi:CubicO group peptidase (beta-lactamase class C family)